MSGSCIVGNSEAVSTLSWFSLFHVSMEDHPVSSISYFQSVYRIILCVYYTIWIISLSCYSISFQNTESSLCLPKSTSWFQCTPFSRLVNEGPGREEQEGSANPDQANANLIDYISPVSCYSCHKQFLQFHPDENQLRGNKNNNSEHLVLNVLNCILATLTSIPFQSQKPLK